MPAGALCERGRPPHRAASTPELTDIPEEVSLVFVAVERTPQCGNHQMLVSNKSGMQAHERAKALPRTDFNEGAGSAREQLADAVTELHRLNEMTNPLGRRRRFVSAQPIARQV